MIRSSPKLAGRLRLVDAGDAAIDRDHHLRSLPGERGERLAIQAVAFFEPMRHVVADVRAQQRQALPQQAGGRHAVDVVIAVDDDPLAGASPRAGCCSAAAVGAGQQLGIAQRGQLGLEKVARRGRVAKPRHTSSRATTVGIRAARSRARIRSGSCE